MAAVAEDRVARDAARWFARMSNAAADHPERGRFEAWLAASHRHAEAYARFDELWADFDNTPRLERLAAALEAQRKAGKAQRQRRTLLGGGAMAVAAVLGGGLWWRMDDAPSLAVARATRRGERLDQPLPDGSRLTLAPESEANVRYFRRWREVVLLRGEAEFEVARDASRPFRVHCADATVTVVGTRFVVQRLPDDGMRVSVLEGHVRVSQGDAPEADLVAGDVAEVPRNGRVHRVERAARTALAWRQGRLVFDGDRLAEVVQQLSRFSSKPLVLAAGTAAVADRRITAVVQLGDVDTFVQQLPRLVPVHLRETPGATRVEPAAH